MEFSIYNEDGSGMKYTDIERFIDEIRMQIRDCIDNGGTYYSIIINADASCFSQDETDNKLYECSICHEKIHYQETTDNGNNIWICENQKGETFCDTVFCKDCFVKKFGVDAWVEMTQSGNLVLCPECYENEKLKRSDKNDC